MIMNKTAYKILAASNASIKSDFITNQMELSKGNVPRMFMGCDVVTFPDDVLTSGEIYIGNTTKKNWILIIFKK